MALHRIIVKLNIARTIDTALGVGPTMIAGVSLVTLSILLVLPVTSDVTALTREDLALALSVVLLGLLITPLLRSICPPPLTAAESPVSTALTRSPGMKARTSIAHSARVLSSAIAMPTMPKPYMTTIPPTIEASVTTAARGAAAPGAA